MNSRHQFAWNYLFFVKVRTLCGIYWLNMLIMQCLFRFCAVQACADRVPWFVKQRSFGAQVPCVKLSRHFVWATIKLRSGSYKEL